MLLTQPYSGPKVKTRFAVSMSGATTGISIADNVGSVFTPAMMRKFRVYIPATMAKEITVYSDGVLGIFITKDKKIRVNYYGIYESMPLALSNNYATIAISVNDNGADAATLMFVVDGVQLGSTQVYGFSPTYLRSLLDTEDGFFLLASPGHGALTSAGTNKLQAPGDAIGMLKDLGANAINFSQATASARPLAGRQPLGGITNWSSYSEQFNFTWTKNDCTISVDVVDSPFGNDSRADKMVESAVSGLHFIRRTSSVAGVNGIRAKSAGDNRIVVIGQNNVGRQAAFDIDNGVIIGAGDQWDAPGACEIVDEGDGWYLLKTPLKISLFDIFLLPNDGRWSRFSYLQSYLGDGSSGVYLSGNQQNTGSVLLDYQRTGSLDFDVTESGVKDVSFAYFDGADDVLSGTVPAITSGTMILAGTNGIWIDENYSVSAGTLSLGPTTVTGCPAGLLAVVGNVIGAFCINRALTTPEKAQLIAMFKAMGAPGWFELGSELVTNGTFDTDTTGYSALISAVLSVESGKMRVTNGGAAFSYASQALTTEVASYYLSSIDYTFGTSASAAIRYGTNAGGSQLSSVTVTASGNKKAVFAATTTSTYLNLINLQNVDTRYSDWDNISVKKLTLNTGA